MQPVFFLANPSFCSFCLFIRLHSSCLPPKLSRFLSTTMFRELLLCHHEQYQFVSVPPFPLWSITVLVVETVCFSPLLSTAVFDQPPLGNFHLFSIHIHSVVARFVGRFSPPTFFFPSPSSDGAPSPNCPYSFPIQRMVFFFSGGD